MIGDDAPRACGPEGAALGARARRGGALGRQPDRPHDLLGRPPTSSCGSTRPHEWPVFQRRRTVVLVAGVILMFFDIGGEDAKEKAVKKRAKEKLKSRQREAVAHQGPVVRVTVGGGRRDAECWRGDLGWSAMPRIARMGRALIFVGLFFCTTALIRRASSGQTRRSSGRPEVGRRGATGIGSRKEPRALRSRPSSATARRRSSLESSRRLALIAIGIAAARTRPRREAAARRTRADRRWGPRQSDRVAYVKARSRTSSTGMSAGTSWPIFNVADAALLVGVVLPYAASAVGRRTARYASDMTRLALLALLVAGCGRSVDPFRGRGRYVAVRELRQRQHARWCDRRRHQRAT